MAPLSLDLTVVVPTVNRPSLLARAVRSCFEGPARPKEVIVVHDDPSCVDRYSQMYEEVSDLPVVRLVNSARKGPSGARNTGWRAASASWVYFLDDDDYLLDHGIATIAEALGARQPEASVFVFGLRVRREDGLHDRVPSVVMRKYGVPFWAEIGTLVIPKHCLDEVGGFDPAIELGENRDLMARLAFRFRVEHVDEPIVFLDYGHAEPRQSENQGSIDANIHLLHKNEAVYRSDPLWWRSAHLYPACHAARRGDLRTSLMLYREWARSADRQLDAHFVGAVASSAFSHLREVLRPRSRRPQ